MFDCSKAAIHARLLCMKRPDLFFPVNAGNRRRMRETLGSVPRNASEYVEMLQRLRSYPWYRAPKPQDEYERELWRNRVGLLDAVFYERR